MLGVKRGADINLPKVSTTTFYNWKTALAL